MHWFGIDEARATLALSRAKTVLQTDTLKPYLLDGGWIQAWNEIDVLMTADENESMPDEQNKKTIHTRFDRLVEFADRLVILDYKLSIPKPNDSLYQKYSEQLSQYRNELQRIYPHKVIKAILIDAQGKSLPLIY